MSITLSTPDTQLAVELTVSQDIVTALASALERSNRLHGADDYRSKLAAALSDAISKSLPWELQSPTSAQLSFAASISKKLQVDVPREATMFRGAMHDFISQHAAQMENDGYVPRKKPDAWIKDPVERAKARMEAINERVKSRRD